MINTRRKKGFLLQGGHIELDEQREHPVDQKLRALAEREGRMGPVQPTRRRKPTSELPLIQRYRAVSPDANGRLRASAAVAELQKGLPGACRSPRRLLPTRRLDVRPPPNGHGGKLPRVNPRIAARFNIPDPLSRTVSVVSRSVATASPLPPGSSLRESVSSPDTLRTGSPDSSVRTSSRQRAPRRQKPEPWRPGVAIPPSHPGYESPDLPPLGGGPEDVSLGDWGAWLAEDPGEASRSPVRAPAPPSEHSDNVPPPSPTYVRVVLRQRDAVRVGLDATAADRTPTPTPEPLLDLVEDSPQPRPLTVAHVPAGHVSTLAKLHPPQSAGAAATKARRRRPDSPDLGPWDGPPHTMPSGWDVEDAERLLSPHREAEVSAYTPARSSGASGTPESSAAERDAPELPSARSSRNSAALGGASMPLAPDAGGAGVEVAAPPAESRGMTAPAAARARQPRAVEMHLELMFDDEPGLELELHVTERLPETESGPVTISPTPPASPPPIPKREPPAAPEAFAMSCAAAQDVTWAPLDSGRLALMVAHCHLKRHHRYSALRRHWETVQLDISPESTVGDVLTALRSSLGYIRHVEFAGCPVLRPEPCGWQTLASNAISPNRAVADLIQAGGVLHVVTVDKPRPVKSVTSSRRANTEMPFRALVLLPRSVQESLLRKLRTDPQQLAPWGIMLPDPPPGKVNEGPERLLCQVYPQYTGELIKTHVERATGFPMERFRLMYNNKEISDHDALWDFNIRDGCTLHVVERNALSRCDGSIDFSALTDGHGPYAVPPVPRDSSAPPLDPTDPNTATMSMLRLDESWRPSATAPPWRWVQRGINVEGLCRNYRCPAHGNGRVVAHAGTGEVHLGPAGQDGRGNWRGCPVCGYTFEPLHAIILGARWEARGAVVSGRVDESDPVAVQRHLESIRSADAAESPPPTPRAGMPAACLASTRREAGHCAHVLDLGIPSRDPAVAALGGTPRWAFLRLYAVAGNRHKCALCTEFLSLQAQDKACPFDAAGVVAKCRHAYHAQCLELWRSLPGLPPRSCYLCDLPAPAVPSMPRWSDAPTPPKLHPASLTSLKGTVDNALSGDGVIIEEDRPVSPGSDTSDLKFSASWTEGELRRSAGARAELLGVASSHDQTGFCHVGLDFHGGSSLRHGRPHGTAGSNFDCPCPWTPPSGSPTVHRNTAAGVGTGLPTSAPMLHLFSRRPFTGQPIYNPAGAGRSMGLGMARGVRSSLSPMGGNYLPQAVPVPEGADINVRQRFGAMSQPWEPGVRAVKTPSDADGAAAVRLVNEYSRELDGRPKSPKLATYSKREIRSYAKMVLSGLGSFGPNTKWQANLRSSGYSRGGGYALS
ncbi:unnamed protein product [Pedinophyceae sp. YPF-701]|nr:unnamed protein product [Pedinophyceae sp. YPF-701]